MRTIRVDQARADLPGVLDEVAAGAEIIISRDEISIARLTRIAEEPKRQRPKVGELRGVGIHIPNAALSSLSADELKEWGL